MPIVTLTTDFGEADGYVGTMKGVILSIAPRAQIVDISHDIEPQNVRQAAYVLSTATPYFPSGAAHVVVVDPGVGSARRPIAVRTQRAFYIGPDNGVLSYPLLGAEPTAAGRERQADKSGARRQSELHPADSKPEARRSALAVVHLDNPVYWLPAVSRTFHGRDIFSPVGAHLAAGVPFQAVGTPIDDAITFALPQPTREPDGTIRGQVLHADRFGNLITDIPMAWLASSESWLFRIAGHHIAGPTPTYAVVERGALLALGGSEGLLEIAVREGSAAQTLGVAPGALVVARPTIQSAEGADGIALASQERSR